MPDLLNMRKFVAPEIIFGQGSRKLAGRHAKQFSAKKVLIVSDPGVMKAGWHKDIQNSLDTAGIPWTIYSQVVSNPREDDIMAGAELFKREKCDAIIAIGGGSTMDTGKGIGIVYSNRKNILDFEGIDKIPIPAPPLICVPTTAGTSSDVSQFCIITDQKEQNKISIVSKSIVPDVSLVDYETTTSMDFYLTACTGIDALVHAMEAFVSKGSGPLTDMYALQAIRQVYKVLPELLKDLNNTKLREEMMLASMNAGLAFSNAILGAVHAMSHSLGGYYDLFHGELNGILLDHVVAYNFDASPEKFREIAKAMDIHTDGLTNKMVKKELFKTIGELKRISGITQHLSEKGIKTTDIPFLSKHAIKDACMITNPKPANQRDLEVIYEESL